MWIKLLVGTTALTVVGAMPAAAQDSPQMDEIQLAQYGGYPPYSGPPPYSGYNPYYAHPGGPYGGPPQYGPPQYGPPPAPQQHGSYGPPPGAPGPQDGPPGGYGVAGAPPPGGQQPGYALGPQGAPGGPPQQSYDVAGVPQYGAPGSQPPGGTPDANEAQPDVTVFTESTVAALKASLKLTPDQEKNWGAFEAAARELAKLRNERSAQLREQEQPKPTTASATPGQPAAQTAAAKPAASTAAMPAAASAPPPVELVESLTSEADALSKHAAALKRFADAVGPLYGSLDDAQKQRFVMGAAPILPQNPPFHF